MIFSIVAVLLAAFVTSVAIFGYPALIVGALVGVGLAFVVILALTGDGLGSRKDGTAG